MIKDALEYLSKLAGRASEPKLLDSSHGRRHVYVIGEAIHDVQVPPRPRQHSVGDLADLIALAERFSAEGTDGTPVVWYGPTGVVLVVDDQGHRLETATLRLAVSSVFAKVVELASRPSGVPYDHKPFLRLLRVELAGAMPSTELYDRVKRVAFENGQTVRADVSRNKSESLGREITSKVSGEGEVPEEVTLMVPVYSTPGETDRYALRCAVEVDPAEGRFRLVPLPDEIERVRSLAVASIGRRLAALPCPSYFGEP